MSYLWYMLKRTLEQKILQLREQYPVLSLTGPRQSGKTTLLKSIYSDLPYVTLEDLDMRHFAINDPKGFLSNYPKGAVFDEVQNVPDLFSYLQSVVDSGNCHFVLSGSQNFLMLESITQSLAGRTAILKLWPLSLFELQEANIQFPDYEQAIFQGGYPRLYDRGISPADFYPSYISTYVERDVRSLKNIENLRQFEVFLQLCAGRVGQVVNLQSLATDAGISPNTAKSWLSILEASFIIHFLQPHHENFNKRLIKSPKLYFCDTGVACSLLSIKSSQQLATHYLKGNLFENLIVNEFIKFRIHQGKRPNTYFWQDKTRKEVDIIVDEGGSLFPYEIKSSKTKQVQLFDNLLYWQKQSGVSTDYLRLIFGGDDVFKTDKGTFVGWRFLATQL